MWMVKTLIDTCVKMSNSPLRGTFGQIFEIRDTAITTRVPAIKKMFTLQLVLECL